MISQEDYSMIADYDCMGAEERAKIIEQKPDQVRYASVMQCVHKHLA